MKHLRDIVAELSAAGYSDADLRELIGMILSMPESAMRTLAQDTSIPTPIREMVEGLLDKDTDRETLFGMLDLLLAEDQ